MKQFCKYSGLILQQSTYLNNLGLPFNKLVRPAEEIVFSFNVFDTVFMATHKPPEKMSAVQRYLLTVALLKLTGTVQIKFPFSREHLTDQKVMLLYPALTEAMVRIASHWHRWTELVPDLPRIENRADNWEAIDWVSYVRDILLPNTALLMLRRAKVSTAEKLDDEIELERQLRQTLLEHRQLREKYQFTPTMGRAVIRELNITLAREDKETLSPQLIEQAMHCFSNKPEKQKVGVHFVERLRELIYIHVKISNNTEDSLLRAQVSLTLGYLDALLDYFNSLSHLFGAITVNKPARLPAVAPVQYTIKESVVPSFPKSEVQVKPANPNLTKSDNPLVQKLLAKKLAEQAAQSTDSTTKTGTEN